VTADTAVSVIRTILKGKPTAHAQFASMLHKFCIESGVNIPEQALISLVPALPTELPQERAHVVAMPD
jgi:hypothetical protein